MKIVVGGDHAGFLLKERVLKKLADDGHEILHVGAFNPEMVDFPDIARKLCKAITDQEAERGIMVCGSGVGAAIACNKIKGIRASVVHDIYTAHQSVEHDNVQVMTLGQDIVGPRAAFDLIDVFLNAKFSGESEFAVRVAKLGEMEA